MFDSKLEKAFKRALAAPANAGRVLDDVWEEELRTASEAELLVRVLSLFPLPKPADDEFVASSPLHSVVAWMQSACDEKAVKVLKQHGGPALLRVYDECLKVLGGEKDTYSLADDLLFALKVICMYAPAGGVERLARAARSPTLAKGFLWSVIFGIVATEGHPWRHTLVDALRSPLPQGFAAVAYLDLANTMLRENKLTTHPFDTPDGLAQLETWLSDPDEGSHSYAHSATAAIPFLGERARTTIAALAAKHPSRDVQLEAAWAAAKLGDEQGLLSLKAACADPRDASVALRYLQELGRDDMVPIHTRAPDFQAIAAMCEWLAHPTEYGRRPKEIAQADTRELYWPPTGDRRRVWLFRYEYPPKDGEDTPDIGYGMVGSVTFALFGETTAERTVEEVYGLHCAWELSVNEDPRAPKERTAAAGMRILAEHNPGFGRRG